MGRPTTSIFVDFASTDLDGFDAAFEDNSANTMLLWVEGGDGRTIPDGVTGE